MKFDKSKVCVAGLHEVPAGTKGYFSDHALFLESYVKDDDKSIYGTIIKEKQDICYSIREKDGDIRYCKFFYPCEEQVKQYRPFETIEEAEILLGKKIRAKNNKKVFICTSVTMTTFGTLLIQGVDSDILFEGYTMEDGTPVGVEV